LNGFVEKVEKASAKPARRPLGPLKCGDLAANPTKLMLERTVGSLTLVDLDWWKEASIVR
jgi:hypothetical protein